MNIAFLRENILSIVLLLIAISLPVTGIGLYHYWKRFVEDSNGYNSINAVITYAGGVINIITIIFLYINYNQQKKQLEFNRTLDIVYKQLEYSKRNLMSKPYQDIYNELMIKLIYEDYEINKEILADASFGRTELNILFEMLEKEIKPYQIIVFNNHMLSKKQKMLLGNLIGINFAERFDITLERFVDLSKKATREPEFLKNNDAEGQKYRLKNLRIAEEIFQLIKGF